MRYASWSSRRAPATYQPVQQLWECSVLRTVPAIRMIDPLSRISTACPVVFGSCVSHAEHLRCLLAWGAQEDHCRRCWDNGHWLNLACCGEPLRDGQRRRVSEYAVPSSARDMHG